MLTPAVAGGASEVGHKVSDCFHSAEGAGHFRRIRGSTLRKQGYSVLDWLTSVFAGRPLMPRL